MDYLDAWAGVFGLSGGRAGVSEMVRVVQAKLWWGGASGYCYSHCSPLWVAAAAAAPAALSTCCYVVTDWHHHGKRHDRRWQQL